MEHVGTAFAIAGLAARIKGWADSLADLFGITSMEGRIAIAFGLGAVVALGLFVIFRWGWKYFMKKSEPIPMAKKSEDESKPENESKPEKELKPDEIKIALKELHELVLPKLEVPHIISMNDELTFDWDIWGLLKKAGDAFYKKVYEARLTGSIEGRIDLTGVKVEVERSKIPLADKILEKIIVNVSIPAGYFTAYFDFTNIEEIRNDAGWLTEKYTIPHIQAAFNEKYPGIVRDCITKEKMIAKTKDMAQRDIETFIRGLMNGLGFKNIPKLKEYDVKVTFSSDKWKIFREAKRELIGEITEQEAKIAEQEAKIIADQEAKVRNEVLRVLTSGGKIEGFGFIQRFLAH